MVLVIHNCLYNLATLFCPYFAHHLHNALRSIYLQRFRLHLSLQHSLLEVQGCIAALHWFVRFLLRDLADCGACELRFPPPLPLFALHTMLLVQPDTHSKKLESADAHEPHPHCEGALHTT